MQAAAQALIRAAATYLLPSPPTTTSTTRERPLALRVHSAVRRNTTRICTSTRLPGDTSSRVSLRQQTPSVHAERGWGSCTREEDFAGQNLLLPEIRFTNPSHARNKPITPAEDSRSLVSFAAR